MPTVEKYALRLAAINLPQRPHAHADAMIFGWMGMFVMGFAYQSFPGDFPLGSLESRAAARAMLDTVTAKDCICFSPEEPPRLELKAEIEAARAVRCPLHGDPFNRLAPTIHRVIHSAGLPSSHSFHSEVFSSARLLLSIPLVQALSGAINPKPRRARFRALRLRSAPEIDSASLRSFPRQL
jgi:hypothetical protein